mmetsp:Transcript_22620/g.73533  ORF Transcript_22620/g.73533 Transcript_22620/m.73533 type:complete len:224 (+) Transcript_22620:4281-4952(+)
MPLLLLSTSESVRTPLFISFMRDCTSTRRLLALRLPLNLSITNTTRSNPARLPTAKLRPTQTIGIGSFLRTRTSASPVKPSKEKLTSVASLDTPRSKSPENRRSPSFPIKCPSPERGVNASWRRRNILDSRFFALVPGVHPAKSHAPCVNRTGICTMVGRRNPAVLPMMIGAFRVYKRLLETYSHRDAGMSRVPSTSSTRKRAVCSELPLFTTYSSDSACSKS